MTSEEENDVFDMQRMGRKQELVRYLRLLSTIAFTVIATFNWEGTVLTVNQGLINGGRAGLIYSYIWNFIFFTPIIISMAEMASMAPTAGSQYHWVSELAPAHLQKPMSYFTGWMSTLAWQAGNTLGLFLLGTLIQTIILITNTKYSFPNWQGTLLVVAATVLALLGNIFCARWLPYVNNALLAVHCVLYVCFIVSVWVLAPLSESKVVFTDFQNLGGWPNLTLSVLAGQLSGISGMLGADTAAHMSEEVKDARKNVPSAMLYSFFLNAILSIPAVITLCFALPDLSAALKDPTGYVLIYVLQHIMSKGWTTAFLAVVVTLLFFSNINFMAATARDLFAFARDSGLPFSPWIAKIHPRHKVPVNALLVTSVIAILLSLIYIGSPVTFYAIVSLFVVAILQCYTFSIASVLWRRIVCPETMPPASFSLGTYGIPINIVALVYVLWAFFWAFWPQQYSPSPADFNWAVVIFVGVTMVSGIYYIFRARFTYDGPVKLVQKQHEGNMAEIPRATN